MTLLADYRRCLAYDVPHTQRKKLPDWCARRDTCARALALRSDPPNMAGRTIDYRVCAVGQDDAYIASETGGAGQWPSVMTGPKTEFSASELAAPLGVGVKIEPTRI